MQGAGGAGKIRFCLWTKTDFSMISVPVGTGDISFGYDIRFADDIRLRRMEGGTDIIHIATKEQYIIRRQPYIIPRAVRYIISRQRYIIFNYFHRISCETPEFHI